MLHIRKSQECQGKERYKESKLDPKPSPRTDTCQPKVIQNIDSCISGRIHNEWNVPISTKLILHKSAPGIFQKIKVGKPFPPFRHTVKSDEEASEEEAGDYVGRQGSIGDIHGGRKSANKVREDNANSKVHKVNNPEKNPCTLKLQRPEHPVGCKRKGKGRKRIRFGAKKIKK